MVLILCLLSVPCQNILSSYKWLGPSQSTKVNFCYNTHDLGITQQQLILGVIITIYRSLLVSSTQLCYQGQARVDYANSMATYSASPPDSGAILGESTLFKHWQSGGLEKQSQNS